MHVGIVRLSWPCYFKAACGKITEKTLKSLVTHDAKAQHGRKYLGIYMYQHTVRVPVHKH